jgi:epoxyqueuosine reductase
LRNLAVALGNAPRDAAIISALLHRQNHPSALVREHVAWALQRQQQETRQEASHVSP